MGSGVVGGWPGKDGIPLHSLSLSFVLVLLLFLASVSSLVLSSLVLDALLQPHPPPSSTCRPCCSSSSTIPLLPPISYFVLSPSSRHGQAVSPHRAGGEGARLPSRPSSSAPNPAPSAIDTPMRATPRQGRCASHNGRRCTAAVKREDQRTREWPRAKGRKDPLSFNGEREKGDRLEEKSMNGSERAEKNGDREK